MALKSEAARTSVFIQAVLQHATGEYR